MFSSELEKYSWEDITACIASKRSRDVEIALGKEHLQLDDFMALVSPAAAPLYRTYGGIEQALYPRTFRQNDTDVCTALYHQFMYKPLCLLWIQSQ